VRADGTVNAAVAFADLAGFTALTEAHGDSAAADIAERLAAVAESVLGTADRLVKTLGDAVLLMSGDATSGIALVQRLFEACETDLRFPDLRAGMHYGEIIHRGSDIFGSTVNIAARITARAGGGEIFVTRPMADAAATAEIRTRRLGLIPLRNLSEPVELFELVRAAGPDRSVDPVCRMMVHPATAAGRLAYRGVDYLFCSLDCAAKFAAHPDRFVRSQPEE
jgi:class 3 adenylate cyclase/YHS domain-containing protein